ncbi:hypothetical protein WA158_001256 [Blastocystis sp. Blastoise]
MSIVGVVFLAIGTFSALYFPYWRSHKENIQIDVVIRLFGYGMIPGFICVVIINTFFFCLSMVICFPNQIDSIEDYFTQYAWRTDPVTIAAIERNFMYYIFLFLVSMFSRALPLLCLLYSSIPIINHCIRISQNHQVKDPFCYLVYITSCILGYNICKYTNILIENSLLTFYCILYLAITILQMIVVRDAGGIIETACVSSTLMLAVYTIFSHMVGVEVIFYNIFKLKGLCHSYVFKSSLKPSLYIIIFYFTLSVVESFRDTSNPSDYLLPYIQSGITVIISVFGLWYVKNQMSILSNNQVQLGQTLVGNISIPIPTSEDNNQLQVTNNINTNNIRKNNSHNYIV